MLVSLGLLLRLLAALFFHAAVVLRMVNLKQARVLYWCALALILPVLFYPTLVAGFMRYLNENLHISCMLVAAAVGSGDQSKVVLDIQNMTCSLCVISVNQALRETDGVIKKQSPP